MTPPDTPRPTRPLRALGAISGTSMDAVDVAVIETDGVAVSARLGGASTPYPAALRADLLALLDDPAAAAREPLRALDEAVTDAFAEAIEAHLRRAGLDGAIDVVGLHGQTVWHDPAGGVTRQLGSGARLAGRLGVEVVDAFRQADVAAGGQGAPLAPLYHAALAEGLAGAVAVLNLGGVGNVTGLGSGDVVAFDTGPASALIDDFVAGAFGVPFDDGGAIAARGTPDAGLVARALGHPFFAAPPPKSLDRQAFHEVMGEVRALPRPEDAVATLTAITVASVAAAVPHLPRRPSRWLVTGGGRRNARMMAGLRGALGVPVEPVEAVGWDGDLLEAECFAHLAARSLAGLPLSLPGTTGVPRPLTGGVRHRPETPALAR